LFFTTAALWALLNEACQIPQGKWGQQASSGLIGPRIRFQLRDEEIGRVPWEGNDPTETQP
jgi:hypothetical protein